MFNYEEVVNFVITISCHSTMSYNTKLIIMTKRVSASMKRFLSLLSAFILLFSCVASNIEENADGDSLDNSTEQEIVEGPDLVLLDISEKTELFDEVLIKDEENILFAKYYESGIVEEYLIISGIDTLLAFFDESGLPKLIRSQGKSILFGDFTEDTALVGIVDENGNSLVEGWHTSVKWKEYLDKLSKETTKASTMSKNIINNTQEEAIVKTVQIAVKKDFSLLRKPESWISYAVSTAAFLAWDNHTYQEFVNIASTGYSLSVIAKTVTPVLAKFPILYTGILIGADLFLLAYDTYLIWDGVKTGKFGSIFNKSEEDIDWFYKELMGGVWLDESRHLFQWSSDETYDVRLHIGLANFDIDDLEWGVKGVSEDDWLEVKTYNDGYYSHFTLRTLKPNEERTPERSSRLVLYVAGAYNVNKDIEYEVIQSSMGYFSEQSLTFSDMSMKTVTFFSPSHESWKVLEHSSWLYVEDNSVQENRAISITPTSLDHDAGYVIVQVESYRGGTYNVILPVYVKVARSLCPDENHPHAIDMGTSVKWACCNVGASSPEEYGDYFAWGEITSKNEYYYENYIWYRYEPYYNEEYGNWVAGGFSKYTNSDWGYDGFSDSKSILEREDDAASANWAGKWRMPTEDECVELSHVYYDHNTRYKWEWKSINGHYGWLVTYIFNNNSIFIPASGYREYSSLYWVGSSGCYWSSTLCTGNPYWSYSFHFGEESGGAELAPRYHGQSVRPVSE